MLVLTSSIPDLTVDDWSGSGYSTAAMDDTSPEAMARKNLLDRLLNSVKQVAKRLLAKLADQLLQ